MSADRLNYYSGQPFLPGLLALHVWRLQRSAGIQLCFGLLHSGFHNSRAFVREALAQFWLAEEYIELFKLLAGCFWAQEIDERYSENIEGLNNASFSLGILRAAALRT